MALTAAGKNFAARSYVNENVYIALATAASDSNELVGHGYSRSTWASGQKTLNTTTTTITNSADLTVYTANDDAAQDATHVALFDAATGGNRLNDWTAITMDISAPTNGQSVVIRTGQISFDL